MGLSAQRKMAGMLKATRRSESAWNKSNKAQNYGTSDFTCSAKRNKTNTKQVTKLNNARYTVQAVIKRFDMVGLAQLVRASGCGPEGRRFEPDISPQQHLLHQKSRFYTSRSAIFSYH